MPTTDRFKAAKLAPFYYSPRGLFSNDWVRTGEGLGLRGRQFLYSRFDQSIVARRVTAFASEAETGLVYEPENYLQMAGLINDYNNMNFSFLRVYWSDTLDGPALGPCPASAAARPNSPTPEPRSRRAIEISA